MANTTTENQGARKGILINIFLFLAGRSGYALQIISLLALLVFALIFALSSGRYPVPFFKVVAILIDNVFSIAADDGSSWKVVEERVVEMVRLPRILVAGLCGAALALSGAALQGMFRNPLVGPQIIGVSSGVAFGGVLAILFMLHDFFYPDFFVFLWSLCTDDNHVRCPRWRR